jgi:hypothetical protein
VVATRWTIRSVDEEIVEWVRELQARTGCGLGHIVSLALWYGLAAAERDLLDQPPPNRPPLAGLMDRLRQRLGLI